jgi:hypothetical protein
MSRQPRASAEIETVANSSEVGAAFILESGMLHLLCFCCLTARASSVYDGDGPTICLPGYSTNAALLPPFYRSTEVTGNILLNLEDF